MMYDNFKHHGFGSEVLASVGRGGAFTASNRLIANANRRDCRRILVGSEDKDVRAAAKSYVENFMLG